MLTSHRKAFKNLAINIKNEPTTTTLPKPSDLNPTNYPLVTLWTTKSYGIAKNERTDFHTEPATRGENVMFWFLQNADGTTVDGPTVSRMRFTSKLSWSNMLDKYKSLAPTWTSLTPAQQLEFYMDIEDKFPFLRLCEDHYKARKIGTLDYTHWYGTRVLGKSKAAARGKKRRHSRTDPIPEDTGTLQGVSNRYKRARRTPSTLSRRASRCIRRSETLTRSQIPGESANIEPSQVPAPSPSSPQPDPPPAPGSPPHAPTLTPSQALSSNNPDMSPSVPPLNMQPGSASTTGTDESAKSPMPSVDKPIASSTGTSGLTKAPVSSLDAAAATGCPPTRIVSHFLSITLGSGDLTFSSLPSPLRGYTQSIVSPGSTLVQQLLMTSRDAISRPVSRPSPPQLEGEGNPDSLNVTIPHTDHTTVTPSTIPSVPTIPECPERSAAPAAGLVRNKKPMRPTASKTAR